MLAATVLMGGQSLLLEGLDPATGKPSGFLAIRSSGAIMAGVFSGTPLGPNLTLTFNGHATAPIPITLNLPIGHGLWQVPTVVGHSYVLASGVRPLSNNAVLNRIYQGTDLTGSPALTNTINQSAAADFTYQTGGDGSAMGWQYLLPGGASFVATSTTTSVLITGNASDSHFVNTDALYVKDVTAGNTITVYDDLDSQFSHGGGFRPGTPELARWHSGSFLFSGTGSANFYSMAASDIEAALCALTNVGVGNLTVASSNGTTFAITFADTGALRHAPQPLITSSDPAMVITSSVVGADVPSYDINGGSHVPMLDWEWLAGQSTAIYCFRQALSGPVRIKSTTGGAVNYTGGGWVVGDGGYGGQTFYSKNPGDLLNFPVSGMPAVIPPGSYRLAVHWTHGLTIPIGGATTLSSSAQFLVYATAAGVPGALLLTGTVDQTVDLSVTNDFVEDGVGWKYLGAPVVVDYPIDGLQVTATTVGSTVNPIAVDGLRLVRTSADDTVTIGPTDVVTIHPPATNPAGWATLSAGTLDAFSPLVATNLAGQHELDPFVSNAKTMKVGYNAEGDTIAELTPRYSDLCKRGQGPYSLTYDANHYPLTSTGTDCQIAVAQGTSLDSMANGYYAILFTASIDDVFPIGFSTSVTYMPGLSDLAGPIKRKVYNCQGTGSQVGPSLSLVIRSTGSDLGGGIFPHDISLCQFYPPDPSDATGLTWWRNPPLFHPDFTGKVMLGMQVGRSMDQTTTNNGNVIDYADFIPKTRLGYVNARKLVSYAVTDVRQYTGTDPAFDVTGTVVMQITLATPSIAVDCLTAVYQGAGNVTLSNGHVYPRANIGGSCRVLPGTSGQVVLLTLQVNENPAGLTVTSGPFSGGTFAWTTGGGSGFAFEDIPALVNAIPTITDWFINTQLTMTDACKTQMATFLANNTRAGVKYHGQCSNETWNPAFDNFDACCVLTRINGLGGFVNFAPGYVQKAMHDQAVLLAAFTAAGRPGDLIRPLGVQGGYPGGSTGGIAAYLQSIGSPQVIDEFLSAPYFDNGPANASLQYLYNLHTTIQDLCQLFVSAKYGSILDTHAGRDASGVNIPGGHRDLFRLAGYPNIACWCYEGGPDINYASPTTANPAIRNNAIGLHPWYFHWTRSAFLQGLQDRGVAGINDFAATARLGPEFWCAWRSRSMLHGTGDATLDALNVTNPEAKFGVKGEFPGGMLSWANLVGVAAQPYVAGSRRTRMIRHTRN